MSAALDLLAWPDPASAREPPAYRVQEERCIARAGDPVREKYYSAPAVGFVLSGWFDYRSETGAVAGVPGTLVLGNRGETFACRHRDTLGNRRLVATFAPEFLESVANDRGMAAARFATAALPPSPASVVVFGWMRRIVLRAPGWEEAGLALAGAALGAAREPTPRPGSVAERQRIRDTVEHIEANYAEPCALETLAAIAGLSRYHFLRLFRAATGQSPNRYLIETRLRAAADRLLATREPVIDIALAVGFNDISHFNACFRRVFACAPRRWREGG